MHREKLHITSAGAGPSRQLLAFLATNTAADESHHERCGFMDVMVYLHGFPDMAVHPTKLDTASRLPFKLAEAFLEHGKQQKRGEHVAFLAFNFGGVPGSDGELAFFDKTISLEVADAIAVCEYTRKHLLNDGGRVHVVGISTGAIIGSLLRDKRVADTITVIAGLADLQKGIHYDFDASQVQQFEQDGACWKEFYLPDECALPVNAKISLDGLHAATSDELGALASVPRKVYRKLHCQYLDECTTGALDIQHAVSTSASATTKPCPFLVIHGEDDQNVPLADGQDLYAIAAEPKQFVSIPKANHLLTNSRHLKKAVQAILHHVTVNVDANAMCW